MKSIEDRLREHYARDLPYPVVPDLANEVVAGGQRLQARRRVRRVGAVVVSVVAVVGIAAALLPGTGPDRAAPPAGIKPTTTPAPSEKATRPSETPTAPQSPRPVDEAKWLESLRTGPATAVSHQTREQDIFTKRFRFVQPANTRIGLVGDTLEGPLVMEYQLYPDMEIEDQDARLAILQDDGSLRRLNNAEYQGASVAADKRRIAAVFDPPPDGGQDEIHVLDVTTGRPTHVLERPGYIARIVGWAGSDIVWTEEASATDNAVVSWSWTPGQQAAKVADRDIAGASSDLVVVEPKAGPFCSQVFRRDKLDDPVVDACIASHPLAISPDQRYAVTEELAIIELATGRMVSPARPVDYVEYGINFGGVLGWEGDAVDVALLGRDPDVADIVRCRAHEKECERSVTPDLPRRTIRIG